MDQVLWKGEACSHWEQLPSFSLSWAFSLRSFGASQVKRCKLWRQNKCRDYIEKKDMRISKFTESMELWSLRCQKEMKIRKKEERGKKMEKRERGKKSNKMIVTSWGPCRDRRSKGEWVWKRKVILSTWAEVCHTPRPRAAPVDASTSPKHYTQFKRGWRAKKSGQAVMDKAATTWGIYYTRQKNASLIWSQWVSHQRIWNMLIWVV